MQYQTSASASDRRLEPSLSVPGLVALRDAITVYMRGQPADRRLRQSVRLLCDHAQRRHQRVEELLVALKDVWWSFPEVQRASRDAGTLRTLLNRIVSMCIEQFYAND
ncbi:MAG TPA: hypothetical protein VFJ96_01875 [Gemmatimonadaceae bacterium]|nr:hypothetical protein [Gemmatimonadaceae bacterium]